MGILLVLFGFIFYPGFVHCQANKIKIRKDLTGKGGGMIFRAQIPDFFIWRNLTASI